MQTPDGARQVEMGPARAHPASDVVTAADDGNEGELCQPAAALSRRSSQPTEGRGRCGRQCPALAVWWSTALHESSPDGQAPRMTVGCAVKLRSDRSRSHPGRLPGGMPDHRQGVNRWGVFDALAAARHGRAQATGMTPQADMLRPGGRGPLRGVYGASGRLRGVERRPASTNNDHQRSCIRPGQRRARGGDLEGGGRVGLYAGFSFGTWAKSSP